MHSFVNNILSNDTHLPSAAKLWQIPHDIAFPISPLMPSRCTPLEVQATSYFAASDNICNFFIRFVSLSKTM